MNTAQTTRAIVIIPARYASQRLPAKPLADIAGKPMIQHVYERASRATLVEKVYVATDDERIASAVRSFGGNVLMTPPDLESGSDRVAFAARSLGTASIIVNVQGDEPLIVPAMIDEVIRPLLEDMTVLTCTLVRKIESDQELLNPSIVKVVLDQDGYCLYFSRSAIPYARDLIQPDWLRHHPYFKHIGLYGFQRELLLRFSAMKRAPLESIEKLEQLRILENGYRIKAAITVYDSQPVDTYADLDRVKVLVENSR